MPLRRYLVAVVTRCYDTVSFVATVLTDVSPSSMSPLARGFCPGTDPGIPTVFPASSRPSHRASPAAPKVRRGARPRNVRFPGVLTVAQPVTV